MSQSNPGRSSTRNDRDCPEPLRRFLLENGIDMDKNPSAIGSAEGWRSMVMPDGEPVVATAEQRAAVIRELAENA